MKIGHDHDRVRGLIADRLRCQKRGRPLRADHVFPTLFPQCRQVWAAFLELSWFRTEGLATPSRISSQEMRCWLDENGVHSAETRRFFKAMWMRLDSAYLEMLKAAKAPPSESS